MGTFLLSYKGTFSKSRDKVCVEAEDDHAVRINTKRHIQFGLSVLVQYL